MAKEGKTPRVLATTRKLHSHKVLSTSTIREYRRAKILVLSLGKGVVGCTVGRWSDYLSAPDAVASPIGLGDDDYRRGHLRGGISSPLFSSPSPQAHFSSHFSHRFSKTCYIAIYLTAFTKTQDLTSSDCFCLEVVTSIRQNVLHTFE